MIIDTHCHLDDKRYNQDIKEVLQRAKDEGIERFIIPGADPKSLKRAIELSEKYNEIYFAVGVHPYDATNYNREYLKQYITHPKCVAVGECGLDYYRLPQTTEEIKIEKRVQKEVFLDQIELAKEFELPLIVHIRDSSADCLEILQEYAGDKGGVLHCYNADEALMKLLSRNFYYGIGGVLTFKNARKLVNVYPKIPLDRVLVETDAPYLTPHPHRGKRNEPSYTKLIVSKMSELSDIEERILKEKITQNGLKLFNKMV